MDLQDQNLWQLIGAIFAALASIAAFLKWVWPLVKQGYENIMGHAEIQERLDKVNDKLRYILEETKPNGGSSLRDAVNRIEDKIELTNERLKAGMLDSEKLFFEADERGNVIWANRTVLRLVQRTPEEILGQGWVNIIAPRMRDDVIDKWQESIDQEREFEMDIIWRAADGTEIPVFVRSYKMSANGRVMGYWGVVKTNGKKAHDS